MKKWDFPIKSRTVAEVKDTPTPSSDGLTELVDNPYAAFEDKADPKVPTATLEIYKHIKDAFSRKPDTHVNRASSATLCHKRRFWQKQGAEGENLTPRKQINFLLGDLTEKTLLSFIKKACVGPGKLYSAVDFGTPKEMFTALGKAFETYTQEDLVATIPGLEEPITGHADGWGKRNSDGKWELIEIKSAANWGFDDFKKVGPKDYLKQAHVLMMTDKAKALGVKEVRFFYLRKETGHLWDRLHPFDSELWLEVIDEYVVSNQCDEPKTPYPLVMETFRNKPTGKTVAGFPCTYCPYLKLCHGEYTLEWKSDQFGFMKPVYVFKGGK